jgi:hypothetical protein
VIELRPLTEDSLFSCDWGYCDDQAVQERRDPTTDMWLAVCQRHTGARERRPSPGRGACSRCGKETALSVDGKVRAHNAGFAQRCPGSAQPPAPSAVPGETDA